MSGLRDRNVVVIGASSGIGRGVALRSVRAGAEVILAARREDRLAEVVREAGGGRTMHLDLSDEAARYTLSERVGAVFDRVDLLFVSSGAAPLGRMAEPDPQEWQRAFETNVFGVNGAVAALVELLHSGSLVAVVSSESVEEPRSHLGAYGASKAALEHSIEQWREEHPTLRFTTVSLGATVPTEFGHQFDPEAILDAFNAWAEAGRSQAAYMDTEEVCDVLCDTFAALLAAPSVGITRISLRSPSPVVHDPNTAIETAAASRDLP